jgi:phage host-nuclease inhibitor protein Gam
MAPPRRKAIKQEAPQTLEKAIALIAEYRDLTDAVEGLKLDAASAIAQIEATRDQSAKPLELRAVEIFRQLRAWWGVAAPEMTEGKRKSIALAGCMIGERTTPPSLKLIKGVTQESLIEKLRQKGLTAYLRITHKLDKPAAIKALQADGDDAKLLSELGASTSQVEEFFIDWPKPEATELVADLEPQE